MGGKISEIDKFEAVDFKYDNKFLKILALKYPNKAFLFPELDIFVFLSKFCNETKSRVVISNIRIVIF